MNKRNRARPQSAAPALDVLLAKATASLRKHNRQERAEVCEAIEKFTAEVLASAPPRRRPRPKGKR